MRKSGLSWVSALATLGLLGCSGQHLHVGDDGVGGGGPGIGGRLGIGGGAAGSIGPGLGGAGGATGSGLSVIPSSATFEGTLVEAVSASQTFTVSNGSNMALDATAGFTTQATAGEFLISSNGCGATLAPGASCKIAVAFAPKTRSGARSATLVVGSSSGGGSAALLGTAVPSLGLLAGGLGGRGTADGVGAGARFNYPLGLASDGAGNFYLADFDNDTIRKVVVATGAVTTLAGKAGQPGSADGIGAAARFNEPYAVAGDGAGNLYVADRANNAVRKVVIATGAVTTVADDTGTALQFDMPFAVATDGTGTIYVADSDRPVTNAPNYAIRKVDTATGTVARLADRMGVAVPFDEPTGILSDGAGDLYVADYSAVKKVVVATGDVTVIAGPDAGFSYLGGIASDGAGHLDVTDFGNDTIRAIAIATGAVTTIAGSAGQRGSADGTGAAARFTSPAGIVGDGAGNLYVADNENQTIRKVVLASSAVSTFVGHASQGGFKDLTGADARFSTPWGAASDGAGTVYIGDLGNNRMRKLVLATGAVTTITLDGLLDGPLGLASDGGGPIYVADGSTVLAVTTATGTITMRAGSEGQPGNLDGTGAAASFNGATGIVGDGAGNLYVADTGNNAVRKVVMATGAVTTFAGGGMGANDGIGVYGNFNGPQGITSDGAGNLYVADTGNGTIRKIVIATGAVTTFAGAAGEFGGADGTGAAARFNGPFGVAGDGAGNLYVADGNLVRKVELDTARVSTVVGSATQAGVSLGALPASINTTYGLAILPTGELVIVDLFENAVLIAHL